MIERLYPGVYLDEVAFNAKPIDGVSTSGWTQANTHDPGVTSLQVFGFLTESLLYRADLSQTSSRYIGETEKNLAALFGDAPRHHAALQYEESEPLFGKHD